MRTRRLTKSQIMLSGLMAVLLSAGMVGCSAKTSDSGGLGANTNTNPTSFSSLNFAGIGNVTAITGSGATLQWTPVAGAVGYGVFDVTGGAPVLKTLVSAPASSYSLSGLSQGTAYKYRVRLVDSNGQYDSNTNDWAFSTTAGFFPTQLSDLTLWLDANDGGSVSESGGLVSQWNDLSSNGAHVSASSGQEPQYTTDGGKKAIYFGGGSKYLRGPNVVAGTVGRTMAVVLRPTSISNSTSNCALALAGNASSGAGFGFFIEAPGGSNGLGIRVSGNKLMNYTTSTAAPTVFVVHAPDSPNVTDVQFRANGVTLSAVQSQSATTLNTETTTGTLLGGFIASVPNPTSTYDFNGYIHEIVVYDRDLSGSEITQLETYLANKWGVSF